MRILLAIHGNEPPGWARELPGILARRPEAVQLGHANLREHVEPGAPAQPWRSSMLRKALTETS